MKRPPDWLLVLVLVAGVYLWQRTVFPLWHIDLFHIQLASLFWQQDKPELIYTDYEHFDHWTAEYYRPEADRLGAWGDPNAYFYPPFLAGALSPFADVHAFTWRNVVFGINILLLFVFASQILRLLGVPFNWRGYLWALALVLLTYPMARACKLAQIVPLQVALFWEALLRMRAVPRLSASLLGLVSAMKLFPVGWLLWPALRGQYRLIAKILVVFIGIFALAVVTMGIDIHLRWWQAIQEFGSITFTYYTNQSPVGWFSRAVQGHGMMGLYDTPTMAVTALRVLTLLLFLGTSVWFLFRMRRHPAPFALEQALFLSGLLLALPVAWEHYFLFVLPPLGYLIFHEYRRGRIDAQSLLLAAASFFFTMKLTRFYGDDLLGRVMSGSQCFGLILLWLYCAFQAQRWSKLRPA